MNVREKWYKLQGCDFDSGVSLLSDLGQSLTLLMPYLGSRYPNPIANQILKKLIDDLPISILESSASPNTAPQNTPTTTTQVLNEPPIIAQIRLDAKAMHKEQAHLHAKVRETMDADVDAGYSFAVALLKKNKQLYDAYNHIRNFTEKGIVPEPAGAPLVVAPAVAPAERTYEQGIAFALEKAKEMTNLQSRISRLNTQLLPQAQAKQDGKLIAKYQQEIADKAQKLQAIEAQLTSK